MVEDLDPIVGNWYRHLDKGQKFEVVAVDEDEGIVEIQHFDGDVEELDLDAWYELEIEGAEPPEDWTGPLDDIEEDDLGYTETDMGSDDWKSSFEEIPAQAREEGEQGQGEREETEEHPPEEPWEGES